MASGYVSFALKHSRKLIGILQSITDVSVKAVLKAVPGGEGVLEVLVYTQDIFYEHENALLSIPQTIDRFRNSFNHNRLMLKVLLEAEFPEESIPFQEIVDTLVQLAALVDKWAKKSNNKKTFMKGLYNKASELMNAPKFIEEFGTLLDYLTLLLDQMVSMVNAQSYKGISELKGELLKQQEHLASQGNDVQVMSENIEQIKASLASLREDRLNADLRTESLIKEALKNVKVLISDEQIGQLRSYVDVMLEKFGHTTQDTHQLVKKLASDLEKQPRFDDMEAFLVSHHESVIDHITAESSRVIDNTNERADEHDRKLDLIMLMMMSNNTPVTSTSSASSSTADDTISCELFAFENMTKVGAGAQGSVWVTYLTMNSTSKVQVALKQIAPGDRAFSRELRALRKLRHTNVVRYFGTTESPLHGTFIVLEFCSLGGMDTILQIFREDAIHRFPNAKLRQLLTALQTSITVDGNLDPNAGAAQMNPLMQTDALTVVRDKLCNLFGGPLASGENPAFLNILHQLISVLAYMHSQKVVHRDIKLENILVDHMCRIRVADFGLSGSRSSQSIQSTMGGAGTVGYSAPEVINGQDPDYASDMYSMAIVLVCVFTGSPPFAQLTNPGAVMNAVQKGDRPELPSTTRPELVRLISAMWSAAPKDRPNAYLIMSLIEGSRGRFVLNIPSDMFQTAQLEAVSEEKSFIHVQIEEAWDAGDLDLVDRLEIYANAHAEWSENKARFDQAKKERNRDIVRELSSLPKTFPRTLEEFEALLQNDTERMHEQQKQEDAMLVEAQRVKELEAKAAAEKTKQQAQKAEVEAQRVKELEAKAAAADEAKKQAQEAEVEAKRVKELEAKAAAEETKHQAQEVAAKSAEKAKAVKHEHRLALMKACREGDVGAVRALIKAGANVSICDPYSGSALMTASEYNQVEVVKLLIEAGAGAYVNDRKYNGITALHCATTEEMKSLLLATGAVVTESFGRNRFRRH